MKRSGTAQFNGNRRVDFHMLRTILASIHTTVHVKLLIDDASFQLHSIWMLTSLASFGNHHLQKTTPQPKYIVAKQTR